MASRQRDEDAEVAAHFAGYEESRAIFDRVLAAARALGPVMLRATRSQIALVGAGPFAWAWVPEKHLRRKAAPLVLSFSFRERREWPRWKEIYEAAPGRYTHHLELWTPDDVDQAALAWLNIAWQEDQKRSHDG